MHTAHDNGGPAYPMPSGPEPRVNATTHYNEGMTILDHFAGLAMQALCEGMSPAAVFERGYDTAKAAYSVAADMIQVRREIGGGT